MKKLGIFKVAESGPVLSTRERGREAADQAEAAIQDGGLILSFTGVEIATPSFLDELFTRIVGLLRKNESLIVAITGLAEEVRESLDLVFEKRQLKMAALKDQQIELLGGTEQLQETFQAAQNLGSFTAPDLAKELEIKLPSLHQRLSALLEAGAVTRTPDKSAKHGRRHVYTAPTSKDLKNRRLRVLA
jgi:DNA-binding MarR family transcriptional regulator